VSTGQSTLDVVVLLTEDHQQVRHLLDRFPAVGAHDRSTYFSEVVHELVAHEVAEEIAVYPVIRRHVPDAAAEIDARLAEQAEAEQLLGDMEGLDAASAGFAERFGALRAAVLAHARAEEERIFPLVAGLESPDARAEMGEHYARAKAHAPTHPHPHAPDTPPGNIILGPIAGLVDRARDAARGA
jgi:hemerythrin superfamily protein